MGRWLLASTHIETGSVSRRRRLSVVGVLIGLVLLVAAVWRITSVRPLKVTTVGRVRFRGKSWAVVSNRSLRASGLHRRDVPLRQNAAPLYREAFNLAVTQPRSNAFSMALASVLAGAWNPTCKLIGPWLDANAAALRRVHEATQLPLCQFSVLIKPGSQPLARLNLAAGGPGLRLFGHLLVVRAYRSHHCGRSADALRDLRACLRMLAHYGDQRSAIQSYNEAVFALACDTSDAMLRVLSTGDLSDADLAALRDSLSSAQSDLPDFRTLAKARENYWLRRIADRADGLIRPPDAWARWHEHIPDRLRRPVLLAAWRLDRETFEGNVCRLFRECLSSPPFARREQSQQTPPKSAQIQVSGWPARAFREGEYPILKSLFDISQEAESRLAAVRLAVVRRMQRPQRRGDGSRNAPPLRLAERVRIALEEMEARAFPEKYRSGKPLPMTITWITDTGLQIGIWDVDVHKRTYHGSPPIMLTQDGVPMKAVTLKGVFTIGADGKWHASRPVAETPEGE